MRARRGVQPTPAGLALLEHARSVLFTMDRMVSDASAFSSGVKGHVRLVATASAIAESLLDDIAAFMREPANRNIKVDVEERLSRDLVRQLRDGMASVGVCWDTSTSQGLAQSPYRRDRLGLAVHRRPPAGRAPVAALRADARLRARRPAADDRGARDAAACRGARRAHRLVPRHRLQLRRRVPRRRRQPGVSVVPVEVGRRSARHPGVMPIPCDAWAERRFAICFRTLESLPPAAQRLVEHLAARRAAQAEPAT